MFPCATGPKHTLFLQTAPERWVPLLRSCHEAFRNGEDPNGDGLHTFAHILSDMAKVYPQDGGHYNWQCLFEQDAIHVVVQLLCDLDFDVDIERCGLTATRNHLSDLLAIFATCIAQLEVSGIVSMPGHEMCHLNPRVHCPRCRAVNSATKAFATPRAPIIQAFLNIWNHRKPLLISDREAMLWRDSCDLEGMGDGLHSTIPIMGSQLHYYVNEFPQFRQELASTLHHVALLCLAVWIYAVRRSHRDGATQCLTHVLTGMSLGAWDTWYQQAVNGCTSQSHVSRAFLRDLNDPLVRDHNLTGRYTNMTKFCMLPSNAPFDVTSERRMFWYALASYRRQLCQETQTEGYNATEEVKVRAIDDVSDYMVMSFKSSCKRYDWGHTSSDDDPWLPLPHIYAAIPFMQRAMTITKTDKTHADIGPDFCASLAEMISRCVRFMHQHKKRPEVDVQAAFPPPSPSMKRCARKCWKEARDMMAAGRYSVKPMWRPVHRAWMRLGEVLELDDNILERAETQQNAVELPVAKRCAWAECLCNAFKPAHGLRVCNGCSAVAYCNKKCQRSDWESHRSQCAGR